MQKDLAYFCLQCSSQRSCRHVRSIQGDARAEAISVEARQQAHIQKFEGIFDDETGQRQVTSISQVSAGIKQIWMSKRSISCMLQAAIAEPSCSNSDAPEATVMSDRSAGCLALPKTCRPFVSADASCTCGLLWSEAQERSATKQGVQSFIFHTASVQLVNVLQLQCRCG